MYAEDLNRLITPVVSQRCPLSTDTEEESCRAKFNLPVSVVRGLC